MKRYAGIAAFSLLLLFLCLISFEQASALDTSLEAGAGYDDNVPQIPTPQGSAFCFSRIKLFQPLFPDNALLDGELFAQGEYRDYFRLEASYSLQAGGTLSLPLLDGRIITGITSDILFYRDDFLEHDERNEFGAGGFIDWMAASRFTLGVRQAWRQADYKNPLEIQKKIFSDMPGNHHGSIMGKKPDYIPSYIEESRDDSIQITGIHGTIYLTPFLQSEILLEHTRANSSIDIESYRENALSASLIWMPEKQWEFSFIASVHGFDYDDSLEDMEREDTRCKAGISINWFTGDFELGFHFEWKENNSSYDLEDYTQKVTQCGLTWSF